MLLVPFDSFKELLDTALRHMYLLVVGSGGGGIKGWASFL